MEFFFSTSKTVNLTNQSSKKLKQAHMKTNIQNYKTLKNTLGRRDLYKRVKSAWKKSVNCLAYCEEWRVENLGKKNKEIVYSVQTRRSLMILVEKKSPLFQNRVASCGSGGKNARKRTWIKEVNCLKFSNKFFCCLHKRWSESKETFSEKRKKIMQWWMCAVKDCGRLFFCTILLNYGGNIFHANGDFFN